MQGWLQRWSEAMPALVCQREISRPAILQPGASTHALPFLGWISYQVSDADVWLPYEAVCACHGQPRRGMQVEQHTD